MPHTTSAKKRLRQNVKRRQHNRAMLRDVKEHIKEFQNTAREGASDQLQTAYNLAAKKLDKAAAKRVIHPNLAARKKSQLAKLLQQKTRASG